MKSMASIIREDGTRMTMALWTEYLLGRSSRFVLTMASVKRMPRALAILQIAVLTPIGLTLQVGVEKHVIWSALVV